MKRFNLEEYLKNPSRRVVTRDGRDVRIICTDKKGCFCIVGLISDEEDEEITATYLSNGVNRVDAKSDTDLFFAPTEHEGWVNIFSFPTPEVRTDGSVYGSYVEARTFAAKNPDAEYYVDAIRIEWEE